MKRIVVLALSVLAPSACGLININGKPLGGSSGSSEERAERAEGAAADPPVGTIEPGKAPPWCPADYERMENDQNARFAGDGGRFDQGSLRNIGRAACDKPGDPQREAELLAWRERFKAMYLATDQDFVNAVTVSFDDDTHQALKHAQCSSLAATEDASVKETTARQVAAFALGCDGDSRASLYELDTDHATMLETLAIVGACLPHDDRTRGEFAFCLHDLRNLDRAQLDTEVAALKPNLYGRVSAAMVFGRTKRKATEVLAMYQGLAKNEAWKSLFDAHEAGWKQWMDTRKSGATITAAVAAFETKLSSGSKKAVAGCGKPLFDLFFDHMADAKVRSKEDVIAAATDIHGYPLTVALMHCAALEGDIYARALEEYVLDKGVVQTHRGPRYAAFHATSAALAVVRSDQESFKLTRLEPYPEVDRAREAASDAAYKTNNGSFFGQKGEISKLTKQGDLVKVDFKTVRWREKTYNCVDTKRIYRINSDGTVEYIQNCKSTGSEARESTLESVLVRAPWARNLAPGQMVDMLWEDHDGKRMGFPREIFANAKATSPRGFIGVVWR